jgi:hypothetical protein
MRSFRYSLIVLFIVLFISCENQPTKIYELSIRNTVERTVYVWIDGPWTPPGEPLQQNSSPDAIVEPDTENVVASLEEGHAYEIYVEMDIVSGESTCSAWRVNKYLTDDYTLTIR